MKKTALFTTAFILALLNLTHAQSTKKIKNSKDNYKFYDSGELRDQAREIYSLEDPDYDSAIAILKQVNENDTNYYDIMYDIAYLHYLDSADEAAEQVCNTALQRPNERTPDFINIKGLSLKRQGKIDESIELYTKYIQVYPKDYLLYNNLGNAYYKAKDFNRSYQTYKAAIKLNPYNTDGYRMMGYLLANSGQLTASSLCYHNALLVKPDADNAPNIIYYLEDVMKSTHKKNDSIKIEDPSIPEYFKEIDLMLKNRLAQNKKYEVNSAFDYHVVRSTQLVLQKLQDPKNDTTFWNRYLVRNFYDIWKNEIFEGYSYYFFQSLTNTGLKKQIEKRAGAIEKFKTWAFKYVVQNLNIDKRVEDNNFAATRNNYYRNNHLYGSGPINNDFETKEGTWTYYHPNGKKMSQGAYGKENQKEGEWNYWHPNGVLKETVTYKANELNGLYRKYNKIGVKFQELNYNDEGDLNGYANLYYSNGPISDSIMFKDGNRDGIETTFHLNGAVSSTLTYVENKLDGPYKSYYQTGELSIDCNYKDGELAGEYKAYYQNGKVKSEGEMEDGKKTGHWIFYHDNGQIEEESDYKNGSPIGEVKAYYKNGKLESVKNLDESGKENGAVQRFDEDGVLYETYEYSKGIISAIRSFDKSGKMTSEFERKKSVLEFEGYSPIGVKNVEGNFDKDGRTGHWTYFDEIGIKESEMDYKEGEYDGPYLSYYADGSIYEEFYYKEGDYDSLFVRYHANGEIMNIGYLIDDEWEGLYYTFNEKGDTLEEEYYTSGSSHGRNHNYTKSFDGHKQLTRTYTYYNSFIVSIEEYNQKGDVIYKGELKNGNGNIDLHYPNGNLYCSMTYRNGQLDGNFTYYHGNGKVNLTGSYKHGKKHGDWKWYYLDGKLESTGTYNNNEAEGRWLNYFKNGNIDWARTYTKGLIETPDTNFYKDGTLDNISERKAGKLHGKTTYYTQSGKVYMVRNFYKGFIVGYTYLDANGKLKPEVKIEKGTAHMVTYHQNGKKAFDAHYKNGKLDGYYQTWHDNGKPWKKINIESGNNTGAREEYYPNGNLKSKKNYFAGEKYGVSTFYYPSGKLKEESIYWNNEKHGESKLYNEAGKLTETQIWFEGDLMEVK